MRPAASRYRTLRQTGWLMSGALIGKLFGFAREVELARLLGASSTADSLRAALTAVMIPIAPLLGDIIPAVLIPLHRQWVADGRAVRLFSSLLLAFALFAMALAAAVYILADWWVDVLVPGFSAQAHTLTVSFVRVMSLMMPASAVCGGLICIEISVGCSRVASLRASVMNVAVIAGIGVTVLTGHVLAIAWSMSVGFNVLLLYGGFMLWRQGEIRFDVISLAAMLDALSVVGTRVKPLLAQPIFEQGSNMLERVLASAAGVGVLASLEYARSLSETLLYLVAQPVGFVVLAKGPAANQQAPAIARMILGLSVPSSVYFAVYAPDLVRVVYERGIFDEYAAILTAQALRGISVGLWAATLGVVLVRILNTTGRNVTASIVIIISWVAAMLVNLSLAPPFGAFGLGLGEGARGLVLLAGSILALGKVRDFAPILLEMSVLGLTLAALCLGLDSLLGSPLARVIAGRSLVGIVTISWSVVRVPEVRRIARRWVGIHDPV